MGDPIHNAKTKKARLEAELVKIQADLKETEVFLSLASKFSNEPELSLFPGRKPLPLPMPPPLKKPSIPDAVAVTLAGGFPVTTQELLTRLEAQGMTVGGDDRNKQLTNLSSTLSRDKARFDNMRGQGWTLRKTAQIESPSPVDADDGLGDL